LYDYQQACKEWDKKKDKSDRMLSDYSLEELKAIMAKVPLSNPFMLFVQAAVDAKESIPGDSQCFDEEDDIPF
jgi:hypothetical protein